MPPAALTRPSPPKSRVVSHVSIRVRSLAASTPWYEALGYTRVGAAADGSEMLPAFGLSRDIGIESIRLAMLPSDGFIGTVMEWTSTPKTAATPSNALAVSVDDVADELARAEKAGLRTEPAALRSYPVLGEALVGACFVDDCRVEFVRFLDC